MYGIADAQRRWAEAHLGRWPSARPRQSLDLDVTTLACERDRLLAMRMVSSLLNRGGRPAEIRVVSDGSLSVRSAEALGRLDPCVRVLDFRELAQRERLPEIVMRFAATHPFGIKLGVLMTAVRERPTLYVDTDVEFLSGAAELKNGFIGDRPRYLRENGAVASTGYDRRVIGDLPVVPGVNAGVCYFPRRIDWTRALHRLNEVLECPDFLTEQSIVALVMTLEGAIPLPEDDFILEWIDVALPWDRHLRRPAVLRHYASPILRWKMHMRGGPHGLRTLPLAIGNVAARQISRSR